MDEPVLLASGLESYLRNLGAPPVNVVSSLTSEWESIVGPALSKVTKPAEVTDGVLTIICSDSAWASQVGWMETQIKDAYFEIFKPTELDKIKIKVEST